MNKDEELDDIIKQLIKHEEPARLALGFMRYEYLRRFNPRQFQELWNKNLNGAGGFDDLIDAMMAEDHWKLNKPFQ